MTTARWLLVALALAAGTTSVAHAQSAAEKAAARQLAVEGIKLADRGDCKAAIEKLDRAEKLFHAPTILGRLGECHVNLGRLVLGTEMLARVEREQLAPGAPPAFVEAKARAAKVRREALPRIGKLILTVQPAGAEGLRIEVDGEDMSTALVGVERPTDPGRHEIEVTASGYAAQRKTVTLEDGQRLPVTIELVAGGDHAAVAPVAAPAAGAPSIASPGAGATTASPSLDPGTDAPKGSPTLGYVLLGVGGAGLAFGGVTGFLASGKKADLDDQCPDKRCPPSASDDLDGAKSLATMSTVGFGVGAGGVVIGTILLLASSAKKGLPAAEARSKITARPFVGVGTVGLDGTF